MKKVFCSLMLIFCINILSYSQIIEESIPRFAETLLSLEKESAENNITNCGFKVLTVDELISLGYNEESIVNLIVGIGDANIICKIQTNKRRCVDRVTVGGVRYLNTKYMIAEYQNAGYILDDNESRGNEMFFVKQTDKYIYVVFIEFAVSPDICIANAEFRKVAKK